MNVGKRSHAPCTQSHHARAAQSQALRSMQLRLTLRPLQLALPLLAVHGEDSTIMHDIVLPAALDDAAHGARAAAPTWMSLPGALPVGSDIIVANKTTAEAIAYCRSSDDCAGFTYKYTGERLAPKRFAVSPPQYPNRTRSAAISSLRSSGAALTMKHNSRVNTEAPQEAPMPAMA